MGVIAETADRVAVMKSGNLVEIGETKEILKGGKYLKKGDLVVNLASMPAKEMGMTNMMKIRKIK